MDYSYHDALQTSFREGSGHFSVCFCCGWQDVIIVKSFDFLKIITNLHYYCWKVETETSDNLR